MANKSGQLLPASAAARYETLQWLMFRMGGVWTMFGQLGFSTGLPTRNSRTSGRCSAI